MKKFICVTLAMGMFAGVAMASSLAVPWWRDNDSLGQRGFIGLKNNTNASISIQVTYYTAFGVSQTPVLNTYVIPANAQVGWRPFETDAAAEGPGVDVPNATTKGSGAATINFSGSPNDLQGRYFEIVTNPGETDVFAAIRGTYAYLLPPGQ